MNLQLKFYEDYGSFNWADPSEESTYWTVKIIKEDGKVMEINEIPCELYHSEEGDHRGEVDIDDGLSELADMSLRYSDKIWSSKNYRQQTINFIKVFNENKEEISKNYEEGRKKNLREEIEQKTRQLEQTNLYPESIDINYYIDSKVERIKGYIESRCEKLNDYKETSDTYKKESEIIDKERNEIKELQALRCE